MVIGVRHPKEHHAFLGHSHETALTKCRVAWGHFAGGGANPVDTKLIDDTLTEILSGPAA